MEINIKLMTEEAYKTLQKNYDDVYKMIQNHPSDSSWLNDYLGFEPYEVKKYVINDFNLGESNYENSVILFEHLKHLPKYILSNNRFWAWITFDKAYQYSISSIKLTGQQIIKNWWIPGNSRRDIMSQVVARLYYKAYVSYDEQSDDAYHLTKYLYSSDDEAYRTIVYRNIGMIQNVCLAVLEVQANLNKEHGIRFNKQMIRELMKDASRIGSVRLIDVMTRQEIYEILWEKSISNILLTV